MTPLRPPSVRTRRRLAWGAPVLVAAVVVGAVALSGTNASGASPKLPARTPAQLIAAVQTHSAPAFSGTFSETANLGIPTQPGAHSSASLSWPTFISGTHRAKVWVDGADRQRLALTGELSEADVVHNGRDVWTYTSATNTVTHNRLPANEHDSTGTAPTDATPAAVAAGILKAVTPSTAVSVDSARTVAGRAAYTLVLHPRDARSTVRSVTIAIDAKTYLPLRVQIFGSGSKPALSLGFSSIDYGTPAASTFAFRTPAGAHVSRDPAGLAGQGRRGSHHAGGPWSGSVTKSTSPGPTVIGRGWTAVVEVPHGLGKVLSGSSLDSLTTSIGGGNRLLHTALVNAVIRADGHVFVGAVTPAVLEHAAATAH